MHSRKTERPGLSAVPLPHSLPTDTQSSPRPREGESDGLGLSQGVR
jgi:hypothetical protein